MTTKFKYVQYDHSQLREIYTPSLNVNKRHPEGVAIYRFSFAKIPKTKPSVRFKIKLCIPKIDNWKHCIIKWEDGEFSDKTYY
jgi:hypothetical protein